MMLSPDHPLAPKYWRYETGGKLAPAVEAYLFNRTMTIEQVAIMRVYLRQWIQSPVWNHYDGEELAKLRADVELIRTQQDIRRWIWAALEEGIDPL